MEFGINKVIIEDQIEHNNEIEHELLHEINSEHEHEHDYEHEHLYKHPKKIKEPKFQMSSWNSKIEHTVRLIEKQCRIYKKMHDEIYMENVDKHSYYMLTAIIITPLSGVVTALGTILSTELNELCIYSITSTILSFISGILITVIKFNKYDEISYSHKIAYSRYISLEENIKRQLMLYREDRIRADEYLNWLSKSFDELFESSPNFDSKTLKKYSNDLDLIEKEYDNNELNFNKQTSVKNNNFLQNHDLNKFSDEKMKLNIGKMI